MGKVDEIADFAAVTRPLAVQDDMTFGLRPPMSSACGAALGRVSHGGHRAGPK